MSHTKLSNLLWPVLWPLTLIDSHKSLTVFTLSSPRSKQHPSVEKGTLDCSTIVCFTVNCAWTFPSIVKSLNLIVYYLHLVCIFQMYGWQVHQTIKRLNLDSCNNFHPALTDNDEPYHSHYGTDISVQSVMWNPSTNYTLVEGSTYSISETLSPAFWPAVKVEGCIYMCWYEARKHLFNTLLEIRCCHNLVRLYVIFLAHL